MIKFRPFLLFVGFLLLKVGFAWSINVDSLITSLKTEKDIEKKITALNDICFGLVYSDSEEAMKYGKRALKLSQKYKKTKLEGKAYNRIGIVFDVTSEWDSALVYYNQAIQLSTKVDDTLNIASANTNVGLIRWHQREYDKAVARFLKGIDGFKLLGRDAGVASCYNNISLIYMDQQRYEKARSYLFKALKIRRQQNNNYALADVLINIATTHVEGEINTDSARRYVLEAIDLFKNDDDHYGLGNAYNTMGVIYKLEGDKDSCIHYMLKSYDEHKAIGNKRDMLSALFNASISYGEIGQQRKRHELLLKCQELVEEIDDLKLKEDIYNSLGMSYAKQGDFSNAFRAYEIRIAITDSLRVIEREEMAERLEVEYRTAEKDKELAEKELALVKSDQQKAEDDLKLSNRNKWIWSLAGGLLGIFFLGLYVVTRNKRRAEREKNAAIIAEQESKINEIIEARELERERISRDLHDGICQTLTALRMQQRDIQEQIAGKDQESAKLLQKSIDTTSLVYNEARELSHQLLPSILEKIGLVQSLRQLLEFSVPPTLMSYEFDSLIDEDRRFSHEIEIAAYRIFQELITNTIKYAEASVLTVQLYERSDNLILIVSDNGKGLSDNDLQKKGAGLINIEQRTHSLNGTFHLEVDNGLTVTVRLPIR